MTEPWREDDTAGISRGAEVCRGRHHRFVVDVKTPEARLAAKARKAGLA